VNKLLTSRKIDVIKIFNNLNNSYNACKRDKTQ